MSSFIGDIFFYGFLPKAKLDRQWPIGLRINFTNEAWEFANEKYEYFAEVKHTMISSAAKTRVFLAGLDKYFGSASTSVNINNLQPKQLKCRNVF